MITIDELKKCHWQTIAFFDGENWHQQIRRCVEHPQFGSVWTSGKGKSVTAYFVGSEEIERGADNEAFLQAVVDALNRLEEPAGEANPAGEV